MFLIFIAKSASPRDASASGMRWAWSAGFIVASVANIGMAFTNKFVNIPFSFLLAETIANRCWGGGVRVTCFFCMGTYPLHVGQDDFHFPFAFASGKGHLSHPPTRGVESADLAVREVRLQLCVPVNS